MVTIREHPLTLVGNTETVVIHRNCEIAWNCWNFLKLGESFWNLVELVGTLRYSGEMLKNENMLINGEYDDKW